MSVGVNVVGFVSARLGIGVAARASIEALLNSGAQVAVIDVQLPDGRSGYDTSWAHLNVTSLDAIPHAINLVHINPPEAEDVWQQAPQIFSGRRNLSVPFFELADMPDNWYVHLRRYDAIMAPTLHIAGSVRNTVPLPVAHYPIAIDVAKASPVTRTDFGIPDGAFAFVTTFDTDSGLLRKNGIGALRAFANAFSGRSDVVLVLKVNGIAKHQELDRALAAMPPARVIVVDRYMPYADVLGLYAACDAFVSLHRAEGLGLGPLEAMLLGKPVVATAWSGNMDFMDDASAALVPFTFTPVLDTQAAYNPLGFSRQQLWAEPDLLAASDLMRRLVEDNAYRGSLAEAGLRRAQARRDDFFTGAASVVSSVAAPGMH
jgi:glycosyltransferase involved in cell wall biosynthesis